MQFFTDYFMSQSSYLTIRLLEGKIPTNLYPNVFIFLIQYFHSLRIF